MVTLSTVAERYPQTVYTGVTFCMQNEWQYVQGVVTDTAPFFSPLEEVIQTHFLPPLLGVPLVKINGDYRQLLTYSIKLGGLATCNPVDTVPSAHKALLAATCHLTVSLVDPPTWFDLGAHCMCATQAGLAARRDWLQNEQIFFDCHSRDKPAMARQDKQNCAVGAWLLVFPNWLNGTGLSANEWRYNVHLRYNHSPLDMPAACDGCKAKINNLACSVVQDGQLGAHPGSMMGQMSGGTCAPLHSLRTNWNANQGYFLALVVVRELQQATPRHHHQPLLPQAPCNHPPPPKRGVMQAAMGSGNTTVHTSLICV